ncbi:uncharacterized protein Dere_GG26809 [Drosophila erecta]|uniref:Uncharacterized protein n=1 Tax=Drosophila erecta TaxID=7220 RepID=A0A0Q5UBF5_DROER|nr:uncharacterized protein Dere_GG26809 [Drosophila erecta]
MSRSRRPVQQTPLNSIRSNDTSPDPAIRSQPHFLLRAYRHPCRPNISPSLSPLRRLRFVYLHVGASELLLPLIDDREGH